MSGVGRDRFAARYMRLLCVGGEMLRQHSSVLYLEDGSSFTGYGFGATKDVCGEVGM